MPAMSIDLHQLLDLNHAEISALYQVVIVLCLPCVAFIALATAVMGKRIRANESVAVSTAVVAALKAQGR